MRIVSIHISQGLKLQTITVYEASEDFCNLTPIEICKCDFNNLTKEAISLCEIFQTKIINCNDKEIQNWFKSQGYETLDEMIERKQEQ